MDTSCKNCGAPLKYDTKTKNVFCQSCDSVFVHLGEDRKKKVKKECPYCGNKFSIDDITLITYKCPYCKQKTFIDERFYLVDSCVLLPFNYYFNEARDILKKKIPFYRSKAFIKEMLEDESSSLYCPFHAYNMTVSGDFTWFCSKTEKVYDGKDENGNAKYREETTTWYEDRFVSEFFKNASITASTINHDSFIYNNRTKKKLTFNNENLVKFDQKYFLMSQNLYPLNRKVKETFPEFIDYAYDVLRDKSRPVDAERLVSHSLHYSVIEAERGLIRVGIPFYYYQSKEDAKYFCWINANSGEVVYKTPLSKVFVFFLVLFGALLISALIFVLIYFTCTNNNGYFR